MRLEGNFYDIVSIEEKSEEMFSVKLMLSPEHKIYEGHFPSQAVVPGVCTLTIIREVLGKILSRDIHFSKIKECKYVSALLPQENLCLTLNLNVVESNKIKATVERDDNQQIVLKLRADIQ